MAVALVRELASVEETERFGAEIALWLGAGDLVALEGAIGAGKTVLARAIINALAPPGEAAIEVPSPTFTLIQAYPDLRIPVAHVDLYRIENEAEIDELGIDEALAHGAVLVEWPERAGSRLPPDRLVVRLNEAGGAARRAEIEGEGTWAPRLERVAALARFIAGSPWAGAARRWLKGDASTRSYERLAGGPRPALVMNAPRGADGPAVRDGKPYSRIAHLAEEIGAFIAVDAHLRALDLSAPEIYAVDLDRGFALVEDFGDDLYASLVARGAGLDEPYSTALDALARLHREPPPDRLAVADGRVHAVPCYDEEAYLIEAELLIDWTWPATHGGPCPDPVRDEYRALWTGLLAEVAGPLVLVLRDFHSPNLLWLPQRRGAARAGLIDFQDALAGHPAYDLVSLAQDARIDLPAGMEDRLVAGYLERSAAAGPAAALSEAEFRAAYAVLGAQRAAKIIGIFTRLAQRDGKTGYLSHIPRVARHLKGNLEHPRLAALARWFASHEDLVDGAPRWLAGAA